MFADEYTSSPYARTRLIIAAAVGVTTGILALFLLSLPNWGLLAQFFQFSSIIRASILVKVFSPILCLLIFGGWAWVILWKWGDSWLLKRAHRSEWDKQPSRSKKSLNRGVSYSLYKGERMTQEQTYTQKPIAVPPLFQLENSSQAKQYNSLVLPTTPIPPTPDLSWLSHEDMSQGSGELISEKTETVPSPQTRATPNRQTPVVAQTDSPVVSISLLRRVRVQLHGTDGIVKEVRLRRGENAIRLILLAYVAWRKGELVDRDKLLTYVLGRGRRRDMNTEQLSEAFDAAKKFLRDDLRKAVADLNRDAGQEVLSEKAVDFFSTESGFYRLHPSCRVTDLEAIEQYHTIIRQARKEGLLDEKLDGTIPVEVLQACKQLIEAYTGDFLQELIETFPDEFGVWVREPYTLYRDYYLDALWLIALHESALGKNFFAGNLSAEQNEEQRRHHIGRAAQLFNDYAMYAINSRVDNKLKFSYKANWDGARISAAERAIRRCVVELGKLGKTDMIDQRYAAFKEKMSSQSEGHWKPDRETENDVTDAKKQTSAYRFSAQKSETIDSK